MQGNKWLKFCDLVASVQDELVATRDGAGWTATKEDDVEALTQQKDGVAK